MFMIREILGYCIISVIGIVCMAVLYAPVCFLLRKRVPPKKQIACFLFGACVIMVLAATVVVGATGTAAADRSLNLVPFRVFQETWDMPQPKKITQTVANIVMFIPWGFGLPFFRKKRQSVFSVVLFSALLPLFIETTQLFIGRSVDIDDLILNFTGGIAGGFCYFLLCRKTDKVSRLSR